MFLLVKTQPDQPIQPLELFKTAYEACVAMVERYRAADNPQDAKVLIQSADFAGLWINTPAANPDGSFDVITLPVWEIERIVYAEMWREDLSRTLSEYKWHEVDDETIRAIYGRADWMADEDGYTFEGAVLEILRTRNIVVPMWED